MVWFIPISDIPIPKVGVGGPRVLKVFPGFFIYIYIYAKKKFGPKIFGENRLAKAIYD